MEGRSKQTSEPLSETTCADQDMRSSVVMAEVSQVSPDTSKLCFKLSTCCRFFLKKY